MTAGRTGEGRGEAPRGRKAEPRGPGEACRGREPACKPELTSRERVRLALSHREADRVPLDFGGTDYTSISRGAMMRLSAEAGLAECRALFSETSQACIVGADARRALHGDIAAVTFVDNGGMRPRPLGGDLYRDEWGLTWRRIDHGGGVYGYEITRHPLADASDPSEIENHDWPDFTQASIYAGLRDQVEQLRGTDYALAGSYAMGSLFGVFWYLRGMDHFFMDLVMNPELAHVLMSRSTEILQQKMVRFLEQTGDALDVFCLCGDLGTQQSLLISPELFREMIKPYLKDAITKARSYTDAKILYHTCGNVYPLVEDLIDCGVDILNPVQVSAVGMDPARLKQEFGDRLVFWGGIDTQHVLPEGSETDVEAEVRLRIEQMGGGGGYVVAPVHNIQNDVPPRNILALYRAGLEHGWYG